MMRNYAMSSLWFVVSVLCSSSIYDIGGVMAQGYQGCVSLLDPSEKVSIGEETIVCLQIANGVNYPSGLQYVRVSFPPKADEYSRFHIPNSYQDLVAANAGTIFAGNQISVTAASQQAFSFLRLYHDGGDLVFPHLTAVINVDSGRVDGITWDDACVFCNKNECLEITYDFNGNNRTQATSGQPTRGCSYTRAECDDAQANLQTLCDLTLYVVWTGDDSNGVAMQSSASRFSAFPEQEIKDRVTNNLPST